MTTCQQQQQQQQQRHLLAIVMMLFFVSRSRDVDGAISIHAPPDYFNDYYTPTTGSLDFALQGNDADVPCVPEKENKLRIEEPIYSWSNNTDYKDMNLNYYPKWRIKSDSGVLVVKDAQLNQSGKYYCSIRSRVRKAEPVNYEHNIAVYQLPEYTMKWMVYHLTKRCDDKAQYKNYVKDVLRMLCLGVKDCVWTFKYVTCIASGADWSKSKWDLMKTWTVGSQSDLIVSFEMRLKVAKGYRVPQCDLICITKNVMTHLEAEFKPKLSSFKTMSRDVYRETLDLTFLEQKMTQEIALLCPAGFEKYKTEVCLPCFPGRAKSGAGDDICGPCGFFAYQPDFASARCKACPALKLTGKRGAETIDDCGWYFKNVIFWVIVILFIILCSGPCCLFGFYYMRWREDEMYFWKKCDKWCGFGYQLGTTKRKMYRRFDQDPNALPQLFEAPLTTNKKELKGKALPEFGINPLGDKKKKGKQEPAGAKKVDDKDKGRDKTTQEKATTGKKDKKSTKGSQKSSAKSSKAPSMQQLPFPPPGFIPPPGFYPPPGFPTPENVPPFQQYPPPQFYYPPEQFNGPGPFPPGPGPYPPGMPPGQVLTPEERVAFGLPPAVPGAPPVNLKDFELSDDEDD